MTVSILAKHTFVYFSLFDGDIPVVSGKGHHGHVSNERLCNVRSGEEAYCFVVGLQTNKDMRRKYMHLNIGGNY